MPWRDDRHEAAARFVNPRLLAPLSVRLPELPFSLQALEWHLLRRIMEQGGYFPAEEVEVVPRWVRESVMDLVVSAISTATPYFSLAEAAHVLLTTAATSHIMSTSRRRGLQLFLALMPQGGPDAAAGAPPSAALDGMD